MPEIPGKDFKLGESEDVARGQNSRAKAFQRLEDLANKPFVLILQGYFRSSRSKIEGETKSGGQNRSGPGQYLLWIFDDLDIQISQRMLLRKLPDHLPTLGYEYLLHKTATTLHSCSNVVNKHPFRHQDYSKWDSCDSGAQFHVFFSAGIRRGRRCGSQLTK